MEIDAATTRPAITGDKKGKVPRCTLCKGHWHKAEKCANTKSDAYVGAMCHISAFNNGYQVFTQDVAVRGALITALIDSGATRPCINSETSRHLRLRTRRTNVPVLMRFGNRTECGLTFETEDVLIRIPETGIANDVSFFVVPDLSYDVILGLSWLQKTNPVIDWAKSAIIAGRPRKAVSRPKSSSKTKARRQSTASKRNTASTTTPLARSAAPTTLLSGGG